MTAPDTQVSEVKVILKERPSSNHPRAAKGRSPGQHRELPSDETRSKASERSGWTIILGLILASLKLTSSSALVQTKSWDLDLDLDQTGTGHVTAERNPPHPFLQPPIKKGYPASQSNMLI